MVDIDPAEIEKLGFHVDVPVCADALAFITGLLDRSDFVAGPDPQAWLQRCAGWKEKYPVVLPEYWEQEGYANTYVFRHSPPTNLAATT